MKLSRPALLLPLAVAAASACSARKDEGAERAAAKEEAQAAARAPVPGSRGQLMVDGKPFDVTSCSPGTKHDFLGFDLKSYDKRRLWISAAPPGRARVHVFRTPVLPVELGRCADAVVDEVPAPIGGVVGEFTADCSAHGHTVTGTMTVTECR